MKRQKMGLVLVMACLITLLGWNAYQTKTIAASGDKKIGAEGPQEVGQEVPVEPLPTVGSFENFKKLMAEAQSHTQNIMMYSGGDMAAAESVLRAPADSSAMGGLLNGDGAARAGSVVQNGKPDYSETNVQVQGVDEADTVKTDGEYIYKITDNQLIIAKAYPVEEMEVVATLQFDGEVHPLEMYVDDRHLTVILNQSYDWRQVYPAPAPPFENSVKVLIYDLADRSNLKQVREIELDGSYLSSRKIGDILYLVNNKYISLYRLQEQPEALMTPGYRDSLEGGEIQRIGYEEICYFPGSPQPNYLLIAGIDLGNLSTKKTEVKTYLGAGQNIYSSLENLYGPYPNINTSKSSPFRSRLIRQAAIPLPYPE
ncbi:beta-propeller domain-containing protein [Desulfitobacterium chlororespirans]|uniref:Beta propeller domain-containing protein n=1 Tax=Desulfitobacterium chlororespirans DSM 11544 TaxID=1121395 RepID=A0A1M7U611_9FIRM|nr:beta-propeller domain-containing protein [Desulfitobacterium chlororespirans]SHN78345.1 Beta propeller domain-containing protein [Desulfitobacterium chlororespirans DSM 11544]